jgi:hypothetical protein
MVLARREPRDYNVGGKNPGQFRGGQAQMAMAKYQYNIPRDRAENIGWVFVGPLLVICHQEGDVPEARLAQIFDEMDHKKPTHVLSTGKGGARINSVQRKKAFEVFRNMTVCALVDNAITRGIVTAIGWLGLNVRVFSTADLRKAVEHLNVPGLTSDEIVEVASTLMVSVTKQS